MFHNFCNAVYERREWFWLWSNEWMLCGQPISRRHYFLNRELLGDAELEKEILLLLGDSVVLGSFGSFPAHV